MKIKIESITELEQLQEEINNIKQKYPDKNYSNSDKMKLMNLSSKSKVLMREIQDNHDFFMHRQLQVDNLITKLLN